MSRSRATDRSPTGARLLIAVVVLIVVVVLLFLVGSITASNRQADLERAWAESLGSFEDLVERHPPHGPNASARDVERLAAPIGVELAPRGLPGRPVASPDAAQRFDAAKSAVFEYLERQIESASPAVQTPPAEVRAFLDATAAQREALTAHLVTAEPPQWQLDLEQGWEMRIPNLLGHINLQRLVAAGALARASNGDEAGALAELEAAWRLNASLRRDPVLIAQLVSMAISRIHLGALRRIDAVPASWATRIRQHDYKRSMLDALHAEGLMWSKLGGSRAPGTHRSTLQSVLDTASRPYMRWCVTDVGERWRRRLLKLSEVEYICDRDLASVGADLDIELPWWNRVGPLIGVPDLAQATARIGRFELDAELTAKLIELRAARRANGGRWPDALPGIEVSSACPQDRFVYRVDADGTVRFELSRSPDWSGFQGPELPTAYELAPDE